MNPGEKFTRCGWDLRGDGGIGFITAGAHQQQADQVQENKSDVHSVRVLQEDNRFRKLKHGGSIAPERAFAWNRTWLSCREVSGHPANHGEEVSAPQGAVRLPAATDAYPAKSGWLGALWRHRAWLIVGLIALFSITIRVRLRDVPLERDEGEYAYAGQLMLQGVPPYKLAYNMKFPGTYAAYALIMGIFGQTASGIHIGLTLVNTASILLMFMLSRKWFDDIGALSATAVFALMSLNPALLGLAGHATHFVVLAALGGIFLALREVNRGRLAIIFASGLLFGLAVLMKQHGILFGAFAGLYLVWTRVAWDGAAGPMNKHRRASSRRGQRRVGWRLLLKESGNFAGGVAVPYVLTCLLLWNAGVLKDFMFWTISYAGNYVSAVPMSEAPANLKAGVAGVFGGNPFLWILGGAGALTMWWDARLGTTRLLLTVLTLFSIAAVSAGFYFREHYFILLLPALGWLSGAAVSRAADLLRHDRSIELLLTIPILLLLLVGLGGSLVRCSPIWFAPSPAVASQLSYGTTLFSEAAKAADYIRENSAQNATVGVLGSEPEVYFLAKRRSATGYIYMYPLMEAHPYALKMQDQMIKDIETQQPEYMVFINPDDLSWLTRPSSGRKLFDWWAVYWTAHYDVVRSQTVITEIPDEFQNLPGGSADHSKPEQTSFLLILKRKSKTEANTVIRASPGSRRSSATPASGGKPGQSRPPFRPGQTDA